jgi:aspartate aminotransferase
MNPTGHTYSVQELQELAEVARRFQLIVLSDEIYGQLHYRGDHVSIARFYPERTIISSGLSKWCGAGGWRLGTFCFPKSLEWLLESMSAVASETYTSVSAPIQHAAVTAFRCGADIQNYLRHARRVLETLARELVAALHAADIRVHSPVGAFYLFLDFSHWAEALARRGIADGATLCERLLEETGVALLPGSAFARPSAELTARLSFVDFDGARALAGGERTALPGGLPPGFSAEYCPNVVNGVKALVDWLRSPARGPGRLP